MAQQGLQPVEVQRPERVPFGDDNETVRPFRALIGPGGVGDAGGWYLARLLHAHRVIGPHLRAAIDQRLHDVDGR